MADEAFVRWDDLDLEDLLGDYTADEMPAIDDDSDSFDEITQEQQPVARQANNMNKKKDNSCGKSIFQCPLCEKQYTSISGFRGHVVKKHNRGDLKAHQNVKGNTDKSGSQTVSPVSPCLNMDEVDSILREAVPSALDAIITCPKNKSSRSKHGADLIAAARSLKGNCDALSEKLAQPFRDAASILIQGSFASSSVEKAYTHFHTLRTDKTIIECVCQEAKLDGQKGTLFTQTLLRRAFDHILAQIKAALMERNVTDTSEAIQDLSDNDQSVLFYVAGYLARKCSKVVPGTKFSTNSPPTNYLKKSSEWVEKVSRGGLLIPSEYFYLLTRELEIIMRQSYNSQYLHAHSLSQVAMMENFINSFMVQHYWTKLGSLPEKGLEFMCKLFLTVRGFAITRKIRNDKTGAKSSKSLRKSLHR